MEALYSIGRLENGKRFSGNGLSGAVQPASIREDKMILTKHVARFAVIFPCALFGIMAPGNAISDESVMYVGYGPGGSFDLQARTMARHLSNHLTGNPKISIRFMPGAGTLTLARYLFSSAKRDGSEFGQINSGVVFSDLLFKTSTGIDFRSLTYLGSPAQELSVCAVWHTSRAQNIQDAKKVEVTLSAVNPRTVNGATAGLINKLIGTRFKSVFGYTGDSQQSLAMERGEVNGRCSAYSAITTTKPDWMRDKKLRFLIHGSPEKIEYLPQVPSLFDMISNESDLAAANVVFAKDKIGNPVVAPPGLPPQRERELISAFAKTMSDPNFKADAKSVGFMLDPVAGELAQKVVRDVHSAPSSVIQRARELLRQE